MLVPLGHGVMQGDYLAKISSQFPVISEQTAGVAVGVAELLLFGFIQGDTFSAGEIVGHQEFFGQGPEIDDDAEIMKQPAEICLAGVGIRDFAGKVAADQGAAEGMLPEYYGIDSGVLGGHVEHTTRHGNIADALEAEANNGAAE